MNQLKQSGFILLSLQLLAFKAPAQAFSGNTEDVAAYYATALDGLDTQNKSPELKDRLYQVLRSAHVSSHGKPDRLVDSCANANVSAGESCKDVRALSYEAARKQLFGRIHLQPAPGGGYMVRDIYCLKNWTATDFPADKQGPDIEKIPFGDLLNTEHTWPKFRFNLNESRDSQLTDLHHLAPSDTELNRLRGHKEFGKVDLAKGTKLRCEGNFVGPAVAPEGMSSSDTNIVYEPPAEQKGNIARALMYFAVRYRASLSQIEEHYLRQWHKEDPVDEAEAAHNDAVYKIQGNRNPFIDYPELVDVIPVFDSKDYKRRSDGDSHSGKRKGRKHGQKNKQANPPGEKVEAQLPDAATLAPHSFANGTLSLVDSAGQPLKTLAGVKEVCVHQNYRQPNAPFSSYVLFALGENGVLSKIKGDGSLSVKEEKASAGSTLEQEMSSRGLPCKPIATK